GRMAARAAAGGRETAGGRDADARQEYASRRHRWRAYASTERTGTEGTGAERAAAARDTSGPAWSAMCEELAAVLRGWPVREIERDVRLSSPQRGAFYPLRTPSLKAARTLRTPRPAAPR